MKTFTNYTPGPRGIVLKDGTTSWIEPGASVDLDAKDVASVPDLGKKADADTSSEDADAVAALQAENAELRAQVGDQGAQLEDLTKQLAQAQASGASKK